jgi:hypothetical protein
VDWRFVALLLVLAVVWWTFTLARGCQGGRPWPLELIPAVKGMPNERKRIDG